MPVYLSKQSCKGDAPSKHSCRRAVLNVQQQSKKITPPESRDIPRLQSGPAWTAGPTSAVSFLSAWLAERERVLLATRRHMAWNFFRKHMPLIIFPNCSKFFPPPPFLREHSQTLATILSVSEDPSVAVCWAGRVAPPGLCPSLPGPALCGHQLRGKNTLSLQGFQREDAQILHRLSGALARHVGVI